MTAEVDVRGYNALKAAVDNGVEQLNCLDIICTNAGIGNGGQTLDNTSEDDWRDDMIDVNRSGVWKTVKVGVPQLISQGKGGWIIRRAGPAVRPRQLRSPHQREHADVHERGNDETVSAGSEKPWPQGTSRPLRSSCTFCRSVGPSPVTVDAGSMLK